MRRERLIPIVVATALFMENTDSTVLATALPAIAADLNEDPLSLKLALTAYIVSLAIFIPISGWMADRFGSRTVFRAALAVFMAGSIACAAASTLPGFVGARFLQGIGGAMMVPVGRLVVLRNVPRNELVAAMAWVTTPALIGPVLGPPLGGFITTFFHWRWIFFINLPIALAGIVLSSLYFDNVREEERPPLDVVGFVLSGLGLALFMLGVSTGGRHLVPLEVSIASGAAGIALLGLYVLHARQVAFPLVDLRLLAIPNFRLALLGGFLFRVGIGAIPFLLPLMLQIGFGLDPLHSGLLTFASAAGAMVMKTIAARALKRFGFRDVLRWNAILAALFIAANGLFSPATPGWAILAILLVGGCFRSLQFTAVNTIIYADVPANRMSAATSFAGVAQQVALGTGITLGAVALESLGQSRHGLALQAGDFAPAFVAVAVVSSLSCLFFWRLHPDAGAEMAGRALLRSKPNADAS